MEDLQKTIEQEKNFWNSVFENNLNRVNERQGNFSSFWDEDYYKKITNFVENLFAKHNYASLLEARSDSGGSSILLRGKIDRTLLDISPTALKYSKRIAQKFKVKNVKFVLGNIKEMMRITKSNGMIAFGMPNFYSGPTIKVWVIKFFPATTPGYRLGTEHFYKNKVLVDSVMNVVEHEGKNIEWIKVKYFGNPLPLETPRWIIKTVGRAINILLPKNRFMIMFFCKFK